MCFATAACTCSTAQPSKVPRGWNVFSNLTSKRASRHSHVHFEHHKFQNCSKTEVISMFVLKCASPHNRAQLLNSSTSKSAPTMLCFLHFDFDMCFAPQRRALFEHLNLVAAVRVHCLLRNVLRATVTCTFSTSQLPKLLRTSNLLRATMACNSWSLVRPSTATKHWKNTVFRDFFYLLANLDLLTTDSFSSDWLSSLTALTTVSASVHQSEVWLLNFLR